MSVFRFSDLLGDILQACEEGKRLNDFDIKTLRKCVDRLAHYEDLDEQGRLVEVVRCRDCKHFKKWDDGQNTCFYWTDIWDMSTDPNGFCYAGEAEAALAANGKEG